MMTLTGGEKYIVKTLVVEINELYPKMEKDIKHPAKLYDYTLEIFVKLSKLTINIIETNPVIRNSFNTLQEIHNYSSANRHNTQLIEDFVKTVPDLIDGLIKLVDDDTSMRDSVLRQIMEELGIVDPNAKKKRTSSFWDN